MTTMCNSIWVGLVWCLLIRSMPKSGAQYVGNGRLARFLTFPPTAPTRLQFIGGIGIPVEDLQYESITSGYVLKAEYFLPETAQAFTTIYLKPQNITTRLMNDNNDHDNIETKDDGKYMNSSSSDAGVDFTHNIKHKYKNAPTYRWIIYRSIETVLERAGIPGHMCLLRSICEHAALPLDHESGLFGEILHIILTPSTSNDAVDEYTTEDYLMAEHIGRYGGDCIVAYAKCLKSPMDLISAIFELDD